MDLSHSRSLIKIPDFRETANLESLILEGCIKLVRINQSIGTLRKLVDLNLKDCKNIVSIPNSIFNLSSLENLNLSGCSKLLRNNLLEKPTNAEHLEKLETNESSIQRQSSSSFYRFLKFPIHSRRHEDSVRSLLPYLPRFPCLQRLDLSFCNLLQIPDAIRWLHSLEILDLGGNHFVTLPSSINELSKLRWLNLEHCKELRYLPELPSRRQSQTWANLAGLCIFNCPKLCLTTNFYRIAFSWMIQLVKLLMQSTLSLNFPVIQIIIPRAEIPRGFSEQNVGSSIRMDSTPIMRNQNWIGVACCVTFVTHDDPSVPNNLYCVFHQPGAFLSVCMVPITLRKDLVTVEFDHLAILYISREVWNFSESDFEGVKFVSSTAEQPLGLPVEVKMCGYKWVYEEDLDQLIHSMEHSGNSSVLESNLLTNESPDELNHGKAA